MPSNTTSSSSRSRSTQSTHSAKTLPDWTGKIVVDTTNSFWTPNADEILQGRLSSEFVAEAFPGAELVKAFNQLPANVLSAEVPSAHGKRVVFVSSNSHAASGVIAQLARDLGFAPIELGRIDEGGRLIQAQNALVLRPLIEQPRS
jgi:8-hydroxy-5-deazaflavin:NADPH oxidoreductase